MCPTSFNESLLVQTLLTTVCMLHSNWLLSHLVLNKMMNTTERGRWTGVKLFPFAHLAASL